MPHWCVVCGNAIGGKRIYWSIASCGASAKGKEGRGRGRGRRKTRRNHFTSLPLGIPVLAPRRRHVLAPCSLRSSSFRLWLTHALARTPGLVSTFSNSIIRGATELISALQVSFGTYIPRQTVLSAPPTSISGQCPTRFRFKSLRTSQLLILYYIQDGSTDIARYIFHSQRKELFSPSTPPVRRQYRMFVQVRRDSSRASLRRLGYRIVFLPWSRGRWLSDTPEPRWVNNPRTRSRLAPRSRHCKKRANTAPAAARAHHRCRL